MSEVTEFFKERNLQSICKVPRKDVRDFYLKTGETGTLLPQKTKKLDKIHKAMSFGHWLTDDTGLWSKKKETKWALRLCQLIAWRSFQDASQGQGTQTELSGLTGLKRLRWEIQEVKMARICETENHREGCWTERRRKRERGTHSTVLFIDRPPWSLWPSTDLHTHERKLLNTTIKELGEQFPEFTQG